MIKWKFSNIHHYSVKFNDKIWFLAINLEDKSLPLHYEIPHGSINDVINLMNNCLGKKVGFFEQELIIFLQKKYINVNQNYIFQLD